jgi:hypothetical protein
MLALYQELGRMKEEALWEKGISICISWSLVFGYNLVYRSQLHGWCPNRLNAQITTTTPNHGKYMYAGRMLNPIEKQYAL